MKESLIDRDDVRKTSLVYIEWVDAASRSGWQYPEDCSTINCATVGWLVQEDKKQITISSTASEFRNCVDPLSIPKKWIIKRKPIKWKAV